MSQRPGSRAEQAVKWTVDVSVSVIRGALVLVLVAVVIAIASVSVDEAEPDPPPPLPTYTRYQEPITAFGPQPPVEQAPITESAPIEPIEDYDGPNYVPLPDGGDGGESWFCKRRRWC